MIMYPRDRSITTLILGILIFLFSWYMAIYFHNRLPDAKNQVDDFNAFNARSHLKKLTGFGPRPAGSYANDIQAVAFLREQIKKLNASSVGKLKLELNVQKASGSFQLDIFGSGNAHQYTDLMNVIVRVSSVDADFGGKTNRSAVLINAHFDSVPMGPGAGDDGANCAVMLEIIRLLITDENPKLKNDVIFLFNGAEESILPASHAFITQHPWAKHIKAFINLEGAGAGGRELLFQSGPNNPWLIQTYINQAPHPFASIIAQEIFQSGLIPSDTDFRIFRDYGHIPGLDVAFIKNGYVYHTENDSEDRIPVETLQRVGDNVLAVVKALADKDNLGTDTSDTTQVFFDVFGLFVIAYPQWEGIIINIVMMSVSLLSAVMNLKALAKKTDLTMKKLCFILAVSSASNIAILLLSVLFNFLIALLMGSIGRTMSWFSRTLILLSLYAAPTLVVTSSVILVFQRFLDKISKSEDEKKSVSTISWFHAVQLFFIIPCLVLTATGYNSGFLFSMSLMFLLLSQLLSSVKQLPSALSCLCCGSSRWSRYILHLLTQVVPLMMWCYLAQLIYTIFIPIMGRNGTTKNPDIQIGVATAVFTFLFLQSFLPVIASYRKRFLKWLLIFSLFNVAITIIVLAAKGGFPYSGSSSAPAQKRMVAYHARRTHYNASQDGGLLFARMDYHDTSELNDISEYNDASPVTDEMCGEKLACGIPLYKRKVSGMKGTGWLSVQPPEFTSNPVGLKEISRIKSGNLLNLTLEVSGTTWLTVLLAPGSAVKLEAWSISSDGVLPSSAWNEKDTYYITFNQGLRAVSSKFWLLLSVDPTDGYVLDDALLDVVVTAHHHHGQEMRSSVLRKVVAKFPPWVTLSAWTVDTLFTTIPR